MSRGPLDPLGSVKVKLGALVAISVVVAAFVATVGAAGGVPVWLSVPVTVALALAVTQLLATGMTSPLRQMTGAADAMARGDHSVRVDASSRDEIGDLARAFNQMAADLDEVDRQRRELIATVSHELRTPLTALCAVLENLADGVSEPDPQTLRTALAQGERLSALVCDLLDLSRIDAGVTPLDIAPVPVDTMLRTAVAEFEYGDRDVHIMVEAPPDLTVHADEARLRQLVANLVDNATRHTPAGGLVTVLASASGGRWRLEVVDEGPGVDPADRDLAFERFGTLAANSTGGGTGLGLAIARWVTDLHGGTIGFADPEPHGLGARVVADLPILADPQAPREQEPVVSVLPPPPEPVFTPQPPLPSVTEAVFGDMWPEPALPGRPRLLAWAIGVGVLAAVALPFASLGLGTFLVLMSAGLGMLWASPRRREPFTIGCAVLCVGLASTVLVRDAVWIVLLCLFAGGLVAVVGLTGARGVPGFVLSAVAWPFATLRDLPWVGRTFRMMGGRGHGVAVVRTVLLSLVGLLVFGLLFASADALFAQWFGALVPDLGSGRFVGRVFVAFAVTGIALAGAYLALNPPPVDAMSRPARPVARRYEWLVPVLVVDAVFAAFMIAQAAALFGGRGYYERTTGLTYAEYVHQGFAQLSFATVLTLFVVWAAARKAPRDTVSDRVWLRSALGALCLMTLGVMVSAMHRMDLYQEAYGFTRLRLLVDVFQGWLGLLVLATIVGGVALRAAWLPRFGLITGAALLMALAALNPDAWIADHNVDRNESTGKVDWNYLSGLSADAVPTLADRLGEHAECALAAGSSRDPWLEWNLGRDRAADVGYTPGPVAPCDDGRHGDLPDSPSTRPAP